MPVHKKKNSTPSQGNGAPSNSTAPEQFRPETFHQYQWAEIRDATRTVMETIMREELSHFLGAEWEESTEQRKGYRNGTYTRDLMTSTGPIEDLNVPRDRAGQFHTQAFEQYCRYEPQVTEGLTQMFSAQLSSLCLLAYWKALHTIRDGIIAVAQDQLRLLTKCYPSQQSGL